MDKKIRRHCKHKMFKVNSRLGEKRNTYEYLNRSFGIALSSIYTKVVDGNKGINPFYVRGR